MSQQQASSTICFSLRERCQTSSVDYLVAYTASVELIPHHDEVQLFIESYLPADADSELLELAIQATLEGFQETLTPLGLGAIATLQDLILHPVDFSHLQQRKFSAQYLADAIALAIASAIPPPSP